jgi:hypothetical protein
MVCFHEQAKFEGDLYACRGKAQSQSDAEFARNGKWLFGRQKRPHGVKVGTHGAAIVPPKPENRRTDG